MDLDLRAQVGQRLVGGFNGTVISPEFRELVKKYKIANVILFKNNVAGRQQLKELCESIQELVREETGHSAFITVDQEGGMVTRLPEKALNVPGQMAIAATGQVGNAKLAARITARELASVGINFNLAPVMDVNSNPHNPVIGVRSFGDTAEQVIRYGEAAMEGYREEGILYAAKHFPGHGDTAVDSHLGLPTVHKTLEELEMLELRPFRAAIAAGVPAVMSSHILFPELESERVPCTMSRQIITELLKKRLGFQGLVLSDCMEMDAIGKYYGTAKGAAAAMAAGVDLVFISHSADKLEEAACEAYRAAECGRIPRDEMRSSVEKILAYKERYVQDKTTECMSDRAEAALETEKLRRDSIAVAQGEIRPLGDVPLFVGCRDFRVTRASDKESNASFPEYMREKLGGKCLVTDKDPDENQIGRVREAAKNATSVVLSTYNGHLFEGQMRLAQAVGTFGIPATVVALRNPYDLSGLSENVTGIAAWEYTEKMMAALVPVLCGKDPATGKMPVKL